MSAILKQFDQLNFSHWAKTGKTQDTTLTRPLKEQLEKVSQNELSFRRHDDPWRRAVSTIYNRIIIKSFSFT